MYCHCVPAGQPGCRLLASSCFAIPACATYIEEYSNKKLHCCPCCGLIWDKSQNFYPSAGVFPVYISITLYGYLTSNCPGSLAVGSYERSAPARQSLQEPGIRSQPTYRARIMMATVAKFAGHVIWPWVPHNTKTGLGAPLAHPAPATSPPAWTHIV